MAMTKDKILAKGKPIVEELQVPGWEEPTYIRVMCGKDLSNYQNGNYVTEGRGKNSRVVMDMRNAHARLAVRCLCDAAGKRIFGDAEADNVGQTLDGLTLEFIADAASKLNKLTKEDEDDLEKNSPSSPSSSSGTESPPSSE